MGGSRVKGFEDKHSGWDLRYVVKNVKKSCFSNNTLQATGPHKD